MAEIKVQANIDNVDEVTAFLDEYLEAHDCPMKAQMQLDVVLDELFSNIANYAYGEGTGDAIVRIEVSDDTAVLTFEDEGMPFDPTQKEEPDITLSLEDRAVGGLGIHLVRKMTDSVSYEYKDAKNILTVVKRLL